MASEAAMTLTADSKADRKYAVNTQFLHWSCVYFRQSPHGVKIRLFTKIRGRKCRNVRKSSIFSGVVRKKGVDLWQKKKWLYIFSRKQLKRSNRNTAELLVQRFRQGSTLICGGNSSGKTTLLNALKETLPDDMAILVAQQADELTTLFHPDMMFLHSLPGPSESSENYDLKHISIAGLTMDVDFFIIGEVKGGEALYLLNAAYTGQICAATVHAPSADRAPEKIVDYAMYDSRYSRNELMKMMDCFQTLVFMEHYQVKEIFACLGWNAEKENLEYERLF